MLGRSIVSVKTFSCIRQARCFSSIPPFATFNPHSKNLPEKVSHLIDGSWVQSTGSDTSFEVPSPLNGKPLFSVPGFITAKDPDVFRQLAPFIESSGRVSKSGLHNPLKNVHRYNLYGDVTARMAAALSTSEVFDYFVSVIQAVAPKSKEQARGEVEVTRVFLQNFCGDQVRFLASGFTVSGDHEGQESIGYRFPYGSVGLVTPFNFPLEIPVLQLMGALYMGNHVTLKASTIVGVVMEQWLRFMHYCGAPAEDVNLIWCDGAATQLYFENTMCDDLILRPPSLGAALPHNRTRLIQFTGSSRVGNLLTLVSNGKIKLEGSGLNAKILGPDVPSSQNMIDYIIAQSDSDAYNFSGQKCSAQSLLFVHENWLKVDIIGGIKKLAEVRKLSNDTINPILSHTTEDILNHGQEILNKVPGAKLITGLEALKDHKIPKVYGAVKPTAIEIPLEAFFNESVINLVTREVFGPFQLVIKYTDDDMDSLLATLERLDNHLTLAAVSNDRDFLSKVLGNTMNGVTYSGVRARTTGAPQNIWFGPGNDPRAAGIGTREAIKYVWSYHRELVSDVDSKPRFLPRAS